MHIQGGQFTKLRLRCSFNDEDPRLAVKFLKLRTEITRIPLKWSAIYHSSKLITGAEKPSFVNCDQFNVPTYSSKQLKLEKNWCTQRRSYQFGFLRSAVKDHENHNEILCQWCKLPRIVITADERKEIINTKIIKRQKCVFCPQGNIQWGVDTLPMFIFLCKKKKIQPRKNISYQLCDRSRILEIIFWCDLPLFDERSFLAFSKVRQTRYMEVVFRVRSNHKTWRTCRSCTRCTWRHPGKLVYNPASPRLKVSSTQV